MDWIEYWASTNTSRPFSERLAHVIERRLSDEGIISSTTRILDVGSLDGTLPASRDLPGYVCYDPAHGKKRPDGEFDLVIVNSVLQYVDDPIVFVSGLLDHGRTIFLGDLVVDTSIAADIQGSVRTAMREHALAAWFVEMITFVGTYLNVRRSRPLSSFPLATFLNTLSDEWRVDRFDRFPQEHRYSLLLTRA